MEDVRGKYVSPAIDQRAFNCPHCGAFATQFWFSVHADRLSKDNTPVVLTPSKIMELELCRGVGGADGEGASIHRSGPEPCGP
jgi:hypothetical protein